MLRGALRKFKGPQPLAIRGARGISVAAIARMPLLHRALLVFGTGALVYGSSLVVTTPEEVRDDVRSAASANGDAPLAKLASRVTSVSPREAAVIGR